MENERAHAELRLQMLKDIVRSYQEQIAVMQDMLTTLNKDLADLRAELDGLEPGVFPMEEPKAAGLWGSFWNWMLKPVW